MSKQQIIEQYEKICEGVVELLIQIYFDGDADHYWIADRVGEICAISDYYFSMSDMVMALKLGTPEDVFFAWYYQSIEEEPHPFNLHHFHNIHKDLPACIHGKHVSQFIRCNDCSCLSLCCDREIEPAKQECKEGETNYYICTNCKKPC